MGKLFYPNFIFIVNCCILVVLNQNPSSIHNSANDYHLEYYSGSKSSHQFSTILNGVKKEIFCRKSSEDLGYFYTSIVFEISVDSESLLDKNYNNGLQLLIKYTKNNEYITPYITFRNEMKRKNHNGFTDDKTTLLCNLYNCDIGVFPHSTKEYYNDKIYEYKGSNIFFSVIFKKNGIYDKFILKLVPIFQTNKYIFNIVFCPCSGWITNSHCFNYIIDDSNIVETVKMNNNGETLSLKLVNCYDNEYVSCGRIEQSFMPPIDVGYGCAYYEEAEFSNTYNKKQEIKDMVVMPNHKLMCHGEDLFDPKHKIIRVTTSEDNYLHYREGKAEIINKIKNLYPGQRLQLVNFIDIQKHYSEAWKYLGIAITYEAKCIVPYLKVTLHLEINKIVQTSKRISHGKFGKIDTYVIDKREMNYSTVGCHVAFDKKRHPAFDDFYENHCKTYLLMFSEKINNFIEVFDVQSLESDRKYKCLLKHIKGISDFSYNIMGHSRHIHETEFIIHLIDSSFNKSSFNDSSLNELSSNESRFTVWIIFGIFIIVTVPLIVGFIILKRLQLKKNKSSNSSSTSSSQSAIKSSTVISKVSNVPIIQKKSAVKKCTNMPKTMITQNSNNKVTNSGQKVVGKNSNLINQTQNATKKAAGKNSNLNLINQERNGPKNVTGKNMNQNKISNVVDSVFKLK